MSEHLNLHRRGFFQTAAAGIGAASALAASTTTTTAARPLSEKEKQARIASNTWPIRYIFKTRAGARQDPQNAELKKKYGELTMLDFPQFTKDTFPGVFYMDLFSGLMGDFADESMYVATTVNVNGTNRTMYEFDPSSASGRKWLDKMAAVQVKTGTRCKHISNNAPRDICDPDPAKRRAGIETAKKWLEGMAILGAQTMRVNSGGPRIVPGAVVTTDYPKNDEISVYLTNCIESFKEMAEFGAKVGVKVTLENHWGLTANPMNIRIIIEEVNHPYCEATPDFCNWGERVHALPWSPGAGPVHAFSLPRQVLEPLEGPRCPAQRQGYDRRRLPGHFRSRIRRRSLGWH